MITNPDFPSIGFDKEATIQESFMVDEIAKAASAMIGRGSGNVGTPVGNMCITMNASLAPASLISGNSDVK